MYLLNSPKDTFLEPLLMSPKYQLLENCVSRLLVSVLANVSPIWLCMMYKCVNIEMTNIMEIHKVILCCPDL